MTIRHGDKFQAAKPRKYFFYSDYTGKHAMFDTIDDNKMQLCRICMFMGLSLTDQS